MATQPQRGHTGSPPFSDQRSVLNVSKASSAVIRVTRTSERVRALAERRKC